MKQTDLIADANKRKRGTKSSAIASVIINKFNKQVARQVLLGNKVLLPKGITIEVEKVVNKSKRHLPRLGFDYKVNFTCDKMKEKKIKFIPNTLLERNLGRILRETNFDYKMKNGNK